MHVDAPTLDGEAIEGLKALREPGMPDPLGELVELFSDNAPQLIAAMRSAVQEGDYVRLGHEAHSLKGSASNIGAVRMTRLCATIMGEVRNPTGVSLTDLVEQVATELPPLKARLLSELQT